MYVRTYVRGTFPGGELCPIDQGQLARLKHLEDNSYQIRLISMCFICTHPHISTRKEHLVLLLSPSKPALFFMFFFFPGFDVPKSPTYLPYISMTAAGFGSTMRYATTQKCAIFPTHSISPGMLLFYHRRLQGCQWSGFRSREALVSSNSNANHH